MTDKTSNPVLMKVRGLKVAYGGIQAVKGVDFEVHEGELVSLIGSNGAGKTTTMKAVTATQQTPTRAVAARCSFSRPCRPRQARNPKVRAIVAPGRKRKGENSQRWLHSKAHRQQR